MENENTKTGLAFFKKDMALWRRSLEGKSYLVDSMMAAAQMARNTYQLSLLLSSASADVEKHAMEWRELLVPLSPEQVSMRPAIEGEIRFIHNVLPGLKRWWSYQEIAEQQGFLCQNLNPNANIDIADFCSVWKSWLRQNGYAFFSQHTATFNYGVPFYKAWLKLTGLPWKGYIEQRDETLAPLAERSKPGLGWVYNPFGKSQFHDLCIWDEYVGRLHDLDAYLRLVRLQLELRLAKIPSEEIPAFIEQLDEAYCSPCADFSWDAEKRMLSFQPYHERSFTRNASASVYVPAVGAEKR
jgi:hypothetical protein